MRRLVLVLALLGTPLRGDEPYLDFVERLRASGLADIAVEYLDEVAKRPPAELVNRLPYERAKSLAALAELQDDDTKRDERLTHAREALEAYLKSGLNARALADARFELARLLVRQGRFRVAAARQMETKAERQDGLAKARMSFDDAEMGLRTATAALNKELDNTTGADRTYFAGQINEAKFEVGLVTMYNALTYSDRNTEQFARRGQELHDARRQFLALAELDANDPLCWRAYVEVGRCWMELDNTIEAFRVYSAIVKSGTKAPAETARIARYYELLLTDRTTTLGSPDVIRGCEEWLSRHAAASRTAEGQGVRFLLASHLVQQAQLDITPGTNGRSVNVGHTARVQLGRAEVVLKQLANADGDYAKKAANLRSEALVLLMAERAAIGVKQLQSFEECFLSAQVDSYQMSKVPDGANGATKRKRHLQRAIAALQHGLMLVSSADDAKDVFTARIMLSYLFLVGGEPYSAAVLGEHLARSAAPAPRGAKAAAYALAAFATILSESRARNAPAEEIATDVRRLRELAEYVERTWPTEPDTDAARFQLGNLFFDDRQYADAIDMFARVGERFPGLAFARYRQGAAAQLAQHKQINLPPEVKKRLLTRSIADLEKIVDPTPGSSIETVLATYQARLQLGQLLLIDSESPSTFDRVEKIGSDLKTKLKDLVDKGDPAFAQLEAESERTRLSGVWGKAQAAINKGQHDIARLMLEPQVRQIKTASATWLKSGHLSEPWFQGFLQIQRDVLLLDARANILAARSDALREDIAGIKALAGADQQRNAYDLLLKLVFDLKKDLEIFKKAGDVASQKQIETGLIGLLDELNRPVDLTADVRVFLAQGYSAIEHHDKAAQLLMAIPEPKADDEPVIRTYRFARLALAREQRLGKEYGKAKATLREILGTQQNKAWGFDNFDVRRESIALLEDEGQFAGAVQMAVQMQNKLLDSARAYDSKSAKVKELRRQQNNAEVGIAEQANTLEQEAQQLAPLRERYYEFYYCEVHALVMHARKNNDAKANDVLARLATRLTKLERAQPDFGGEAIRARFAELMTENPTLRDKYLAVGGKVLVETGGH